MKKGNKFVFFTVVFLLLGGTLLSINKAQIQIVELEKDLLNKNLMSFNLAQQKIESYLSNLQDKITIKSYQYSDELNTIFQNPDDNEELLYEIQNRIKQEIPNVNQTILANKLGEMIIVDFDGYIGDSCQKNLKSFASGKHFELRVHPNSLQYHFDIMVRYDKPKQNISGIFFTSFVTERLQEILKEGEGVQSQLFLIFNQVPNLIEVSSSGNRRQIKRKIKLSENEVNRISISRKIKNSSWTLVNLPSPHYLNNQKLRIYVISIFEILFLYFISGILFYSIYKKVSENKKISQRYLLFLEKTEIVFFVINRRGLLQYANSALIKIIELKNIKNIIGKPVLEWMNPEMWEAINQNLDKVDKEGQLIGMAVKRLRKNGDIQSYLIDIIIDRNSKQTSYAIFCKDTSELNQIEQLKLEREAAVLSEQSKTEFLANISHELRTPMHGILSYASMGIKRINKVSKDDLEKYFTNIEVSGIRLLGLLNDLLDLSKLEAGQMEMNYNSYDLSLIAKECLIEQQSYIEERNLKVVYNMEAATTTQVDLDNVRISQVIANLLSNAIKFSYENGCIEISIYSVSIDKPCGKVDAISLSIKNEGKGIPEEDLDYIFGKFKQSGDMPSSTRQESTGLGLAICKEIIEAHHGRIRAQSEQGKNAMFVMTIPLRQDIEG